MKKKEIVVSVAQRNSNKTRTEKRRLNLTVWSLVLNARVFMWHVGDGLSVN